MSKIIESLTKSLDKGNLLEKVLFDILENDGFFNINIQNKGSQYGFDLSANKQNGSNSETYRFECKNLNKPVTVADFSPKIIWQIDSDLLNRFVLVTISGISNDLALLLETKRFSFHIEIWNKEILENKISKSKKALERLNLIELFDNQESNIIKPIIFEPCLAKFHVFHALNPPFSFDFFYHNNELIKSYTENTFKLLSVFENKTNESLIINSLVVKTMKYEKIESRILRQHKMKGRFKLEKFIFSPKTESGAEMEMLEQDYIINVLPKSEESFFFEMSNKANPGYYELAFIAKGVLNNKQITICSPSFPLHIRGNNNNLLILNVVGKHYESPVPELLNLENEKWNDLRRLSWNKKYLVYLGNTTDDIAKNQINNGWLIKTVKAKKTGKYEKKISQNSKVYMKLDTLMSEKPFDLGDSIKNIFKIE